MPRLFRRRPPRDSFDLDTEDAAPPAGGEDLEPDAERELGPSTGRQRRPLKTILALGIVAVGLGALYLSWSGGRSDEIGLPPRLLPQGPPPLTQRGTASLQGTPTPPVASVPPPPPSAAPAAPHGPVTPPA